MLWKHLLLFCMLFWRFVIASIFRRDLLIVSTEKERAESALSINILCFAARSIASRHPKHPRKSPGPCYWQRSDILIGRLHRIRSWSTLWKKPAKKLP